MYYNNISQYIDHTLLKPTATRKDYEETAHIALSYQCASVCVPPASIEIVKPILAGSGVALCSVIGFPLGYQVKSAQVYESQHLLNMGVKELDMVINIGRFLSGEDSYVHDEIATIAQLAHSADAILKVIIETSYLSDAQKVHICKISESAGADFVKTSTGFAPRGATIEDVTLMRQSVSPHIGVKASGGIRDCATLISMLQAGATRIGTSNTASIMQECSKQQF